MHYYIRRYRHGLRKIQRWLPLVFLPPVVYLLISAAVPDRFSVSQMLVVQKTAPIARTRTPVDIMTMGEMVLNPAELFLDDIAISDLIQYVEQTAHSRKDDKTPRNLRTVIANGMSLRMDDDAHVLLSYYGWDVEMGKVLVNHYAQRLIGRSKDGQIRSMKNMSRHSGPESTGPPGAQPTRQDAAGAEPGLSHSQPAATEGNVIIQKHHIFWRADRLLAAAVVLAGSLVFMFILAGFVEWTDLSFKSERQISRYLNLRVIGGMPDIEPLVRRMKPVNPPH